MVALTFRRYRWLAFAATLAVLLTLETPAWAPHIPQLNVTPASVRPGGTVSVIGTRGFSATGPIDIRLDDFDGPILASAQPVETGFALFGPVSVHIPDDAKPGVHFLVATQANPAPNIRSAPTKALIQVVGDGVAAQPESDVAASLDPPVVGRPDTLDGPGARVPELVLVALGTAAVALVLAAAVGSAIGRSSPSGAAETADTGKVVA
jgi:hypothetical protein